MVDWSCYALTRGECQEMGNVVECRQEQRHKDLSWREHRSNDKWRRTTSVPESGILCQRCKICSWDRFENCSCRICRFYGETTTYLGEYECTVWWHWWCQTGSAIVKILELWQDGWRSALILKVKAFQINWVQDGVSLPTLCEYQCNSQDDRSIYW